MNKAEQLFAEKAVKRGGIPMYSKNDALDFVRECRKHGITILGIDGFFLTERTTQPSMEDSVDYSSVSNTVPLENVYEDALSFIGRRTENLFFEIVCD